MSFVGPPKNAVDSQTFTDSLLESVAPWNDPEGFWVNYNAALGALFEDAFAIAADQGDPNAPTIAALSAPLSTTASINALPVSPLAVSIAAGAPLSLASVLVPGYGQLWTVATAANVGDTTIAVGPQVPNAAYPVGSQISAVYVPGFSTLLDPYNCPDQFLPYLAQFVGIPLSPGMVPATMRLQIIYECAFHRGTPHAIVFAARRNLSGSQFVQLFERLDPQGNANAYWFILVVLAAENTNQSGLVDAVNAVKPGGVQWTLVATTTWTIAQLEASYGNIGALEAAFASIAVMEAGGALVKTEAVAVSETVRLSLGPSVRETAATRESVTITHTP